MVGKKNGDLKVGPPILSLKSRWEVSYLPIFFLEHYAFLGKIWWFAWSPESGKEASIVNKGGGGLCFSPLSQIRPLRVGELIVANLPRL